MSEYQESPREKEGRVFLIDLINKAGEAFLRDNPTLDRLESAETDQETWRRFAAQRYLAAIPFESLLEACKTGAEAVGNTELARVVSLNIQDETGLGKDGEIHPELSHATWRRDFYTALGVSEEALAAARATEGTRAYEDALRRLIEYGDSLVIAGAILALEGTIPREFSRMKKGRDLCFPEDFLENEGDSPEVRARKAKARLYLDDHIIHDAKSHYPDLLTALEPHALAPDGRMRLQEGVKAITEAKKAFYDGWDT